MYKFFGVTLPVIFALLVLQGCDSIGAGTTESTIEKTQDDASHTRAITVFLKPQQDPGYIPVLEGRVVEAAQVSARAVVEARGNLTINDVDVVHIGKSCAALRDAYPDLLSCEEAETVRFEYGDVETTVVTDSDGFASLFLGDAEKYRLKVKSFATDEDAKCFWGGQETIDVEATTVTIPLLVFCE